jgi:hypothetical protein
MRAHVGEGETARTPLISTICRLSVHFTDSAEAAERASKDCEALRLWPAVGVRERGGERGREIKGSTTLAQTTKRREGGREREGEERERRGREGEREREKPEMSTRMTMGRRRKGWAPARASPGSCMDMRGLVDISGGSCAS